MQNSVIVFDKNSNSREIIKSYLESFDFIGEVKLFDDYIDGYEEVQKCGANSIVIMDISSNGEDIKEMADRIKLCTPKLVITSTNCSTNDIIRALRLGAKEFLPKPVLKEDLSRILQALSRVSAEEIPTQSKIITVYSNKGGIGKTTIAINLALELAKVAKDKVALLDLNLQLGDVSTFLNLNPVFDVNYVLNKLVNNENSNLIKAFEKYKDTSLYILSDPNYIEQAESIKPQQIPALFEALRKEFSYIIVDMSSNIDENSLKILDCSDWIMFTTIVNIPAIRNAQRCLNLFHSRRYPKDKVKIVVNRYMDNDEIKIDDIENTLAQKVYWKIPNNYFTIMEAINKGMTISEVNPSSNISNSFRDFASKVSDDIIEQSVLQYRV